MESLSCADMQDPQRVSTAECQEYEQLTRKYTAEAIEAAPAAR
jgi:hypothetical protein